MEQETKKDNFDNPMHSKFVETKKFKDWFWDLFSNPDGSGSTKNTAGWVLILAGIISGFILLFIPEIDESVGTTVFISFLTYGTGMFIQQIWGNKDWFNFVSSMRGGKKLPDMTNIINQPKQDGNNPDQNQMLNS